MALTKIGKEGITGIDNSSDTTAITIDSSENVGIGTASPQQKLDIKDDNNSVQAILRGRSSDSFGILDFRNNAGDTVKGQIKSDASNRLIFRSGPSNDVMYLNSSGNVGIGVSSPSTTLHLDSGGTPTTIQIDSDTEASIDFNDHGGSAKRYKIGTNISSNDGQLEFKDMTANAERMRIDSSGNVGIGTTSPSQLLHINSTGNVVAAQIQGASHTAKVSTDGAGTIFGTTTNGYMLLTTNSAERMRIHSGGNVTIGTTNQSPAESSTATGLRLGNNGGTQIGTDGGTTLMLNRNTSDGTLINFRRAGAEVGAIQSFSGCLAIGSYVGNDAFIRFGDSDVRPVNSSGTDRNGAIDLGSSTARFQNLYLSSTLNLSNGTTNAFIQTSGDLLQYGTSNNKALVFYSNNTERMRIDTSGILNINTTAQQLDNNEKVRIVGKTSITNSSDWTLLVNRDGSNGNLIAMMRGTAVVGSISVTTSSTSYNTSSDHRLKENVSDMTDAIDRIKQLSPKRFNFIADADTTVDGFLAHEAQTIVPEAVTGTHNEVDDDGNAIMQGIDQSKLVPLLTGALKEAIAKIETLETRIEALENA